MARASSPRIISNRIDRNPDNWRDSDGAIYEYALQSGSIKTGLNT